MAEVNDFNAQIIEEFRANDGKLGGPFEGASVLLLHHKGAKTGTERVNPVAYRQVGDSLAVFASKGGAPDQPRLVLQPARPSRTPPSRWAPRRSRSWPASPTTPSERPSGKPRSATTPDSPTTRRRRRARSPSSSSTPPSEARAGRAHRGARARCACEHVVGRGTPGSTGRVTASTLWLRAP